MLGNLSQPSSWCGCCSVSDLSNGNNSSKFDLTCPATVQSSEDVLIADYRVFSGFAFQVTCWTDSVQMDMDLSPPQPSFTAGATSQASVPGVSAIEMSSLFFLLCSQEGGGRLDLLQVQLLAPPGGSPSTCWRTLRWASRAGAFGSSLSSTPKTPKMKRLVIWSLKREP